MKSAAAKNVSQIKSAGVKSWPLYAVLFVLCWVVYGNTLKLDYALDDTMVITDNKFTKQGFGGMDDIFTKDSFVGYFGTEKSLVEGGRYRPLSIATFAIEVELFGLDPGVSHFVNVLLFACTVLLLFRLLLTLFPPEANKPLWASLPFLVSLLFAVHPIHTEVVANIKGRDEIMALLFSLLALQCLFGWMRQHTTWKLAVSAPLFFLALLSKESALPLIIMLPLAVWYASDMRKALVTGVMCAAAAVPWFIMRSVFTSGTSGGSGEWMNNPFIHSTYFQQMATAFSTLPRYFKLLLVPYPLTHDYYPDQIPVVGFGDVLAIAGVLITAGLLVFALVKLPSKHPAAFGVLWFFITVVIVSNVFINVGVLMSERFVYIPSVGFLIALVWFLKWVNEKTGLMTTSKVTPAMALIFAVSAVYIFLSVNRNPVWKDNFVLFTTDVETSTRSAKSQTSAGGELLSKAMNLPKSETKQRNELITQALFHLDKALEIYPQHGVAWLIKGNAYAESLRYEDAIRSYLKAVKYKGRRDAMANCAVVANSAKNYVLADSILRVYLSFEGGDASKWYLLGQVNENKKSYPEAIEAYTAAHRLNNNPSALAKIGRIKGQFLGDLDGSIEYLNQSIRAGGNAAWIYNNLGIAYGMKGDFPKSAEVLNAGLKIHPSSDTLKHSLATTQQLMANPPAPR